jgi:peptide/nickel transport system substrate-binding protein
MDGDALVDADGNPLTLKLLYGPNTSKTLELIALAVQDYMSEVGIQVDIQALEWSSYLQSIQSDDPDWDMYLGAWSSTIEPQIMYTIWAEDSIPQLNAVGYINKDVEALFEEAGKTYDTDFRIEKYQEIQQIVAEESPYVFLFYQKSWAGLNNRVKGIEPTALGIGWNAEDWYIEE